LNSQDISRFNANRNWCVPVVANPLLFDETGRFRTRIFRLAVNRAPAVGLPVAAPAAAKWNLQKVPLPATRFVRVEKL